MTTIPTLTKHYVRILNRWPQDLVRPDARFQSLLRTRIQRLQALKSLTDDEAKTELKNINVLYALLDNQLTKEVRPLFPSLPIGVWTHV
jgi:hypothetical protein